MQQHDGFSSMWSPSIRTLCAAANWTDILDCIGVGCDWQCVGRASLHLTHSICGSLLAWAGVVGKFYSAALPSLQHATSGQNVKGCCTHCYFGMVRGRRLWPVCKEDKQISCICNGNHNKLCVKAEVQDCLHVLTVRMWPTSMQCTLLAKGAVAIAA